MTATLPPICPPCQGERSRWLDTRPSEVLPQFGIAHGSGTAYDASPAGIGDNRRSRYEQWRQLVQSQRDLIARTCREQRHTTAVTALDDHRHGVAKPRLLDLFCGAGGAAMGYHRAGFEIVGVDIQPQPNYPFEFHQADAMTYPLDGFDAVHASPPCKDHTSMVFTDGGRRDPHGTGWMLPATIERLAASGLPYVVENVPAADMPGAFTLCGRSFGIPELRRHRQFVTNVPILVPPCACRPGAPTVGVYGDLSRNDRRIRDGYRGMRAGVDTARRLLGCPWMDAHELSQAIPPAYTEHIGGFLLAVAGADQVAAA